MVLIRKLISRLNAAIGDVITLAGREHKVDVMHLEAVKKRRQSETPPPEPSP